MLEFVRKLKKKIVTGEVTWWALRHRRGAIKDTAARLTRSSKLVGHSGIDHR
jgi:hypothetical protein